MEPSISADSHQTTSDFRSSFVGDLKKSVLYDNTNVLHKLLGLGSLTSSGDSSLNETVIDYIARAVRKDCAQDLQTIDIVANQKADDEQRLLMPLKKICDKIEQTLAALVPNRAYFRHVIHTADRQLSLEDPVFPNSDDNKPDFVVADVPDPRFPIPGVHTTMSSLQTSPYPQRSVRWRQCFSFVEVKAKAKYSPTNAGGSGAATDAVKTLVQGADYARFALISHPFNLFVYGVFVCGNQFCLAFFDRCGIVLSPDYSVTQGEGLRLFVRVVTRLLWTMSPTDLGQDPTIYLEPGHTYHAEAYPSYRVTMGTDREDTRSWITQGPPLWVSHTLLGRGTVVWRVLGPSEQARLPCILKTAWRSSNRDSELDIYDKIKYILTAKGVAYPRSVAQADNGGDVLFDTGRRVSVKALRGFDDMFPPVVHGISDRILHRVAVRKLGKPLWEYSSVEQLIRALIGVIEAHKILTELGILHRDISAGNILIEVVSDENGVLSDFGIDQTCGFLTDFELASVPQQEFRETTVAVEARPESGRSQGQHVYFESIREQTPTKTQPGDGLTGTAIFMAYKVLLALSADLPIVRTKEHDLESFLWVIVYVVYKHALNDTEVLAQVPIAGFPKKLRDEFHNLFSATSIHKLVHKRNEVQFTSDPYANDVETSDVRDGVANLLAYADQVDQMDDDLDGELHATLGVFWHYLFAFRPRKVHRAKNATDRKFWAKAFGESSVTDQVPVQATHDRILTMLNKALAGIVPRRMKREKAEQKARKVAEKMRKASGAGQKMQVD
ncbi:hypothetical protein K466DRAFT_539561 [Polyporus arcularius HHB13444]|uniref:Protein kinase domain-containing protein n=1 Tax=Polyporus arcularius HHB13444 TaxID=1314778 RepID=A0A5C3Q2H1_9APHY|nr:hypothetical protein K466DRAFT_539561 [Polyporus arcularius HHB13444]